MAGGPVGVRVAADMEQERPIRVVLSCTGVDLFRGGHETFARECFEGLRGTPGLDLRLIKAAGTNGNDEVKVWCLRRQGAVARLGARLTKYSAYAIEQVTSIPGVIRELRAFDADVLFTSEHALLRRFVAHRKKWGLRTALVHSNGAPMEGTSGGLDMVQQCTPFYYTQAVAAETHPERQMLVPYGVKVPAGVPGVAEQGPEGKRALRRELGLPAEGQIVISVGWVSPTHKRMDHTVREVAKLPKGKGGEGGGRPFLLMMGRTDDSTAKVEALARELLGEDGFAIRSVPAGEVAKHYRAADVFTLASLVEGFGRVYLEALVEGLPCVVHDHAIMRYVLKEEGVYVDMNRPGEQARALAEVLAGGQTVLGAAAAVRRREAVRRTFGWETLAGEYLRMFRQARANADSALGL